MVSHPNSQPSLGAHLFILQIFTEKIPAAKSCARHWDTKEAVAALKGLPLLLEKTDPWWVLEERKAREARNRRAPGVGVNTGFLREVAPELSLLEDEKGRERWEEYSGQGP